jgi:hypothetical protein
MICVETDLEFFILRIKKICIFESLHFINFLKKKFHLRRIHDAFMVHFWTKNDKTLNEYKFSNIMQNNLLKRTLI